MHTDTQFSVFMVNKPGILALVLGEFAHVKVNVIALTMMDSVEHGVLRVVGASAKKIRTILEDLNLSYNETDVLCVTLPNKAGAFADITQKLAKAHINISYAYCTAGARGGRTTAILKVADVKKAMKVIKPNIKGARSKKIVRRQRSPRR